MVAIANLILWLLFVVTFAFTLVCGATCLVRAFTTKTVTDRVSNFVAFLYSVLVIYFLFQ